MEWIELIINGIIWLTVVLPLISMYYYERFDSVERKFVHYIAMLAVFEIIAYLLINYWNELGLENSLPGLHLFTLCQYIFITIFFYHLLKRYHIKFPLQVVLWIGCVLIVINTVFVQGIYIFNSYSKVAVEIVIIGFSMLYFLKVFLKKEIHKNERSITFFVSAVFINAGMSILIHLISNELVIMKSDLASIVWNIRTAINAGTLLVMLYGVYLIITRKRKSSAQENLSLS